jgi:hypothetical protein
MVLLFRHFEAFIYETYCNAILVVAPGNSLSVLKVDQKIEV